MTYAHARDTLYTPGGQLILPRHCSYWPYRTAPTSSDGKGFGVQDGTTPSNVVVHGYDHQTLVGPNGYALHIPYTGYTSSTGNQIITADVGNNANNSIFQSSVGNWTSGNGGALGYASSTNFASPVTSGWQQPDLSATAYNRGYMVIWSNSGDNLDQWANLKLNGKNQNATYGLANGTTYYFVGYFYCQEDYYHGVISTDTETQRLVFVCNSTNGVGLSTLASNSNWGYSASGITPGAAIPFKPGWRRVVTKFTPSDDNGVNIRLQVHKRNWTLTYWTALGVFTSNIWTPNPLFDDSGQVTYSSGNNKIDVGYFNTTEGFFSCWVRPLTSAAETTFAWLGGGTADDAYITAVHDPTTWTISLRYRSFNTAGGGETIMASLPVPTSGQNNLPYFVCVGWAPQANGQPQFFLTVADLDDNTSFNQAGMNGWTFGSGYTNFGPNGEILSASPAMFRGPIYMSDLVMGRQAPTLGLAKSLYLATKRGGPGIWQPQSIIYPNSISI